MAEITFSVDDSVAIALAVSRGWSPTIEDTSQPLEGDTHPLIPNPVSFQQFVSGIATATITEHVLNGGRQALLIEFQSIFNNIEDRLKSGTFDPLILAGDFDGIKAAVKSTL